MSTLAVLQLSDTHFRLQYDEELEEMGIEYYPPHILETFLSTFHYQSIDCVVITGDLVHEGTVEDYQAFESLVKKYIPEEIPIYYTLGNHDKRDQFYLGMKDILEPRSQNVNLSEQLYDYIVDTEHYRFIFLDNYNPRLNIAEISLEQSQWLEDKLNNMTQSYAILFMHHPIDILIHNDLEKTKILDETREILDDPKLLGIFTGHVHMNRSSLIGTTPQWTSLSMYAGFHPKDGRHYYTNHLGFNIIHLNDDEIDVFADIVTPTKKYYQQINF